MPHLGFGVRYGGFYKGVKASLEVSMPEPNTIPY